MSLINGNRYLSGDCSISYLAVQTFADQFESDCSQTKLECNWRQVGSLMQSSCNLKYSGSAGHSISLQSVVDSKNKLMQLLIFPIHKQVDILVSLSHKGGHRDWSYPLTSMLALP